jgi:ABC-type nickel/cobalt efflux system permease component RcnA
MEKKSGSNLFRNIVLGVVLFVAFLFIISVIARLIIAPPTFNERSESEHSYSYREPSSSSVVVERPGGWWGGWWGWVGGWGWGGDNWHHGWRGNDYDHHRGESEHEHEHEREYHHEHEHFHHSGGGHHR